MALITDGVSQLEPIELLRDRRSEASVHFEVLPSGEGLKASLILFAEDGVTVIQAARFEGAVATDLAHEAGHAPSFSLRVLPAHAVESSAPGVDASLVFDGHSATIASPEVPLAVSAATARKKIKDFARGLGTAAGNHAATGAPIEKTLIDAARFGARMAADLEGLEQLRALERIQVISLEANTILPLELIYDREPPTTTARMCSNWQDKLKAGHCTDCGEHGDTRGSSDTVCPFGFWAMSKVIEHHVAATDGTVFEARPQRLDASSFLAQPARALVGASKRVLDSALGGAPDPLAPIRQAADSLQTVEVVAQDWDAWEAQVLTSAPQLLIGMPHQGRDEEDTFSPTGLELGGKLESTFGESFVRRPGDFPGPVMLLIGCDISVDEDQIASFASAFRRFSPVVIATVGKIIASEAPIVAAALLRALGEASRHVGDTVGVALRKARRELLAAEMLVGFQLVGHGDSDCPLRGDI